MTARVPEFPFDATGFLLQECPACRRRFKIQPGEPRRVGSRCPYCAHRSKDWWTDEQRTYLHAVLTSALGGFLGGKLAKVNFTLQVPEPGAPPVERDDDYPHLHTFACCGTTIRHDGDPAELRCIHCA